MKKPNFFIVGAPKCGTTALNDYLSMHPDIFMATKELHYFGSDLKVASRPSEAEYLKNFESATNEKVVGEASVWYLFSKTAASEIKRFSPEANILIMLRDPVDVIHSLHSQHLYDGNEDVPDFETAISLDEERKNGRNLPESVDFTELPPYVESVLFSEQVRRYLDVFGRERVHIILYEDFIADTPKAVAGILQFLGIDPRLHADYKVVNANKQIRLFWLHRLLKKPSASLKTLVRLLLPFKSVRHAVMHYLFRQNIEVKKRPEMCAEVQVRLQAQVTGDVEELSKLLNRDLSAWLQ
jgi:hypothetical protein